MKLTSTPQRGAQRPGASNATPARYSVEFDGRSVANDENAFQGQLEPPARLESLEENAHPLEVVALAIEVPNS
jgi:hypothetical protein